MAHRISVIALACAALLPCLAVAGTAGATSRDRLENATTVLKEIMQTPDRSIPQELLDSAYGIVIIPGVKKGAFIIGANYGKGYISCRHKDGVGWSAPGTVIVEGGSFGFQIGGEEADVVMLVMNQTGVEHLLHSQFTLGAGGAVAAGPVGRTAKAETDAMLSAEILSWSRTHGVFAGISLQGATLRQDLEGNMDLYGRELRNREITQGNVAVPAAAKPLISYLDKISPRREEASSRTTSVRKK